ncbi:MAG TPA: hypothetical protein VF665_04000 [Longimicrobium sp.]|jgi:hypothetical protein|uniref:hypothetical protein n=1 Tax=Longimicrobium sp. TaxID=2029185 RepID=UPI002ED93CE4
MQDSQIRPEPPPMARRFNLAVIAIAFSAVLSFHLWLAWYALQSDGPGAATRLLAICGVIAGCALFLLAVHRAWTTGLPLQRSRLPACAIACMAAGAAALIIDTFLA